MVAVLPVFATRVLQVEPPSVDLSILYPVIVEPPLSAGRVQVRPICEEETAGAASPSGEERTAGKEGGEGGPGEDHRAKEGIDENLLGEVVPCARPVCVYV